VGQLASVVWSFDRVQLPQTAAAAAAAAAAAVLHLVGVVCRYV